MTVRKARKLKSVAAVALCSMLLILASAIVFPRALGATNDTEGGIAVITEQGATQEEAAPEQDTPSTDAVETPAEEEPATGEIEVPTEEQEPATDETADPSAEGGAAADDASGDEAAGKGQAVVADEQQPEAVAAEPRSIVSIRAITANANMPLPAEQWNTDPTGDSYVTIDSSISGINSQTGVAFSDLVAAKGKTKIKGGNQGNDYLYWRAVLLGKDQWRDGWQQKTINYGPDGATQPWSGDTYYADSGTTVTKVRYQNNQLQFMPAEGEDNAGQWVSINGNGSGLQLVWYYLQLNELGKYVNLEYSHWGLNSHVANGNINYATPYAAMGQVVDADTGEVLANGKPMYWYGNHKGVTNAYVSEQNLGEYEIVGAAKYKAVYQTNATWTGTENYDKNGENSYLGDKIKEYPLSDIQSMGTDWDNSDGSKDTNHVIFRIYVRKTAQASLVKQLDGNGKDDYEDKIFTFSATVTLPEAVEGKVSSTLRDTYPIEGTANGSTSVRMVVSADGKSGTVTGIQAKPGQKVTLKGLPYGATVKFTETGVPTQDPSVFTTTYVNDKTDATDGTATAKHSDGKAPDESQTVTATNTVSSGEGKLTVTKTFKGLTELTALERENLYNSFQITSTANKIPALTLKNASSKTGDILADNVSGDITYTWNMAKLTEGQVTLTEENYAVGGKGMTTVSQVATDGAAFKPSATTEITDQTKEVKFTNEYGTTSTNVKIRKAWSGVAETDRKSVTVQLKWTGKENGKETGSGIQDEEIILDKDNGWTTTVSNLPQHTGTYGDITWSIVETKVGDKQLSATDFDAAYTTDADGTLVVTNSLKPATLVLTKKVSGDAANKDEHFTFSISGATPNVKYKAAYTGTEGDSDEAKHGDLTADPKGVLTVQLKHDEKVTIAGLPGSATLNVTENVEGLKVSSTTATGGDKADETVTSKDSKVTQDYSVTLTPGGQKGVTFTNTTNHAASTGISISNSLPMAGIGAAAVAGIAALAVAQRKRNVPLGSHARKE